MTDDEFDLAVIGTGPGGYVCALRAAQLGLSVCVIESGAVGGTSLNWGCIPTKSLLDSAHMLSIAQNLESYGITTGSIAADYAVAHGRSRKAVRRLTGGVSSLLKKAGVVVIEGHGELVEGGVRVGDEIVRAAHVVIATGAKAQPLPGTPFDGSNVMSYRDALGLEQAPKSIVIVGAGPIGLEFANVFAAYGADVTVLEAAPTALPGEDADAASALGKALAKQGIDVICEALVSGIDASGPGVVVNYTGPNGEASVSASTCLVAIGIEPNTDGLEFDRAGVSTSRGFIAVDEAMATSSPNVYAIGDVVGRLALAHVASAEGTAVAETIAAGTPRSINYDHVPRCVYTEPQLAAVGLTETEAIQRGHETATGTFPLAANGRAVAAGGPVGFAKVVLDAASDELLGVHIVGPMASEMIAGAVRLLGLKATVDELIATIHPHPTYSESIFEAGLVAKGEPIHV